MQKGEENEMKYKSDHKQQIQTQQTKLSQYFDSRNLNVAKSRKLRGLCLRTENEIRQETWLLQTLVTYLLTHSFVFNATPACVTRIH